MLPVSIILSNFVNQTVRGKNARKRRSDKRVGCVGLPFLRMPVRRIFPKRARRFFATAFVA